RRVENDRRRQLGRLNDLERGVEFGLGNFFHCGTLDLSDGLEDRLSMRLSRPGCAGLLSMVAGGLPRSLGESPGGLPHGYRESCLWDAVPAACAVRDRRCQKSFWPKMTTICAVSWSRRCRMPDMT